MRILVGASSCGISAGALNVVSALERALAKKGKSSLKVETTGCIGMCFAEPLVEIRENGSSRFYAGVSPEDAELIAAEDICLKEPIERLLIDPDEFLKRQTRIVLRNCGRVVPSDIDDCIKYGDSYKALEKALSEKFFGEGIISEIRKSGLRGRGGGGFPTHLKWSAARNAAGNKKYIVCNADEGDPGAFMDRSVLESDPHSVIEGIIIAGAAIGAHNGIIYLRAEYPLAVERMKQAVSQAEKRGFLGENIMKSGFSFNIAIKEGAGAFVCGEETALIASLEGRRGMPEIRPPYPAEKGVFGCPTCINNVETLANVPWIILNGGEKFASIGTPASKGAKVFAVAGKAAKSGLVEIEMGTKLSDVVFGICGGVKDGGKFKAVQLGGPSGGCLSSEFLDVPLDYESVGKTGAIMGSGGMVVLDESSCMVDIAKYFLSFTQAESCGKCSFCRIGSKKMLELLNDIMEGKVGKESLDELQNLAESVKRASLCGLGQSAPNPVLTSLKYFKEEYLAHIEFKRHSDVCRKIGKFSIVSAKCRKCGLCMKKCPVNAIFKTAEGAYVIDADICVKCGQCAESCAFKAISRS